MKLTIAMDDTDNLETQGTGWLLEDACKEMAARGWGPFSMISRHQLFVHRDIPYTSHNSAMVVEAESSVDQHHFIEFLGQYLAQHSAPGSDPGLCIVPELQTDVREALISFGLRAKREVITKDHAHSLARDAGVHLSEHGGTGGGVIGALAGVGLRLWGNDGRYRGWLHLGRGGQVMTAAALKTHPGIEDIRTPDGGLVAHEACIALADQLKTVCMDGKSTLLVHPENRDRVHAALTKNELKCY
ncbi:MAG: hypothetical protein GXY42_11225 [Desulfovibrionales bacterium]|nr:hypothetical protein [Desulfovibrionales bacterium]